MNPCFDSRAGRDAAGVPVFFPPCERFGFSSFVNNRYIRLLSWR